MNLLDRSKNGFKFKLIEYKGNCIEKNCIYLMKDSWDDWFTYRTTYNMIYVDIEGNKQVVGFLKIGEKGLCKGSANLSDEFYKLSDSFFSLGMSIDYYDNINKIFKEKREEVFRGINDVIKFPEFMETYKEEEIMKYSLLRDHSLKYSQEQYERVVEGGAKLTPYSFKYKLPNINEDNELVFKVEPNSYPPTNIHVLIGKNGVGKTTQLQNIVLSIKNERGSSAYGEFNIESSSKITNIVFISFSIFDNFNIVNKEEGIPYLKIGVTEENRSKSMNEINKEFCENLWIVAFQQDLKKLWKNIVSILEADLTFESEGIIDWIEKKYNGTEKAPNENLAKKYFKATITPKFEKLSSGHKIILLIIVNLIVNVKEKTLVLIDEPEGHLHPPLVSNFMRALSKLLTFRNGVGIISTHSPVVLQEVPKKCVWKIRRNGDMIITDRLVKETFGENLGILTNEVFGIETIKSGFYAMLKEKVNEDHYNYEEILDEFNGEIGIEGKGIVKILLHERDWND